MYSATESHLTHSYREQPRYQERVSTIADLKVLYLFKNALRRLEEEVPCEDYGMWLDSENRVLRFHTAGSVWNPSALVLQNAAAELGQLMAAMSF
jgi:hypothetical protein